MAPSPLLYTASPIVPDQPENDEVSPKLTVEVAERTLALIEEVLESGKVNTQKKVKKTTRKRDGLKEWVKHRSVMFFLLLAFLAVLVAGVVDLVTEITACGLLPTRRSLATQVSRTCLVDRLVTVCLPLHVGAVVLSKAVPAMDPCICRWSLPRYSRTYLRPQMARIFRVPVE